jgi:hypothetical protein
VIVSSSSSLYAHQPSGSGDEKVAGAPAGWQKIKFWHTGVATKTYAVKYYEYEWRGAAQGWVSVGNGVVTIDQMTPVSIHNVYWRHEKERNFIKGRLILYQIQDISPNTPANTIVWPAQIPNQPAVYKAVYP